jgi:hypothetical protein
METTITADKRKITDWINSLEDKTLLDKIKQLMTESKPKVYYSEEEARKISKDKIAEWFGK